MKTIDIEITDDFLKDLLITAVETPGCYGIGYWANVIKITKEDKKHYTEVKLAYDLSNLEEGNRKGRFILGLPQLAQGIRRIMTTDSEKMKLHSSNAGVIAAAVIAKDSGQIDGEAIDWIVQAAIFNEVIYG